MIILHHRPDPLVHKIHSTINKLHVGKVVQYFILHLYAHVGSSNDIYLHKMYQSANFQPKSNQCNEVSMLV